MENLEISKEPDFNPTGRNCIYCGQFGNEWIAIGEWVACMDCFIEVFNKVLKKE